MELKVWVEGIQRVVCGVSEVTSCQDVVIALAHATGKTGRFTLIEKWRDTERLLSPSDCPIKALHKWGEYASEVVFILRHSDRLKKERSAKRTDKFLHNFTPHTSPSEAQSTPGSKGIKKSLTFSGAHSHPKKHLSAVRRNLIQDNSSLESIDDQSSITSQSSMSTLSPCGSLDKRHHRHKGLVAVPHHNNNNHKSLYGSLEKHRPKSNRLKSSSSPYSSSSHHSSPTPRSGSAPTDSIDGQSQQRSPSHSSHETTPTLEQVKEYDLIGDGTREGAVAKHPPSSSIDFTRLNGNVGKDTEFREGSPAKTSEKSAPAEKEDLVKLIKLQQEKLSVQASQIKLLDSEIQYLEKREEDCEREAAQTAVQLKSIQKRDAEVDNDLQELDIVSWADKLEIEKQNQKTLQSEITLIRSRLANCETELLQKKHKTYLLAEDIEKERKEIAKQEQERREQELKVLQDISEVQKQLNQKLLQHQQNQDNIESLQNEVKKLESDILEGKTQLGDYEKELRGVNMEIFMKVPNSLEGSTSGLNRMSPSRPGSARRIYSPILLKEAVATTTNPHGLWV